MQTNNCQKKKRTISEIGKTFGLTDIDFVTFLTAVLAFRN